VKVGDLVRVTKHGARNRSAYRDRVGIIVNLDYGYPLVLLDGGIRHFGDGEMSIEVIR
jgi:hypothetical protein